MYIGMYISGAAILVKCVSLWTMCVPDIKQQPAVHLRSTFSFSHHPPNEYISLLHFTHLSLSLSLWDCMEVTTEFTFLEISFFFFFIHTFILKDIPTHSHWNTIFSFSAISYSILSWSCSSLNIFTPAWYQSICSIIFSNYLSKRKSCCLIIWTFCLWKQKKYILLKIFLEK